MSSRIVVPLLAVFGLVACGQSGSESEKADLPAVAVTTAQVERVELARNQPVAGTVRPVDRAVISARVMGTVASLPVDLGTRVTAGQTLLTLSAAEVAARLDQARSTLAQVERELAQEQSLLSKGATTAEAVRVLEDRRRTAAAAVDEATTLWNYTTVTAPFSGVITRRYVQEGDLASPGSPLVELEGLDRMRLEVEVPESLDPLQPGTSLTVELGDTRVTGRLAEISPAADPTARTRLAKVDLPSGAPARSGQFARVLWPAGTASDLLVPSGAVTTFGQMERVFVVEEGRARLRLVRTGGAVGDRMRLQAGVDAGETVIVDPPATLRDGQPLQISR